MSTMQQLLDLAIEMQAEVTFSMDSTCVNVSMDNSFIATSCEETRDHNLRDCIEFLEEIKEYRAEEHEAMMDMATAGTPLPF